MHNSAAGVERIPGQEHNAGARLSPGELHMGWLQLPRARRCRHRRDGARGHQCERIFLVRRHKCDRGGQPHRHSSGLQRIPDVPVRSQDEPMRAVMTAVMALLRDRRRSQRGSVLSGVLIMTAFIAIISGALMTELSTNFLLSHTMLNRVANQATDNSAIELSLHQLQAAPLNGPCPTPATATVNNLTASANYLS